MKVGDSIPSAKFGCWVVNEIRGERTRLLSGDLKHEVWEWTATIEAMLKELESIRDESG